jgi:hypothetical protein
MRQTQTKLTEVAEMKNHQASTTTAKSGNSHRQGLRSGKRRARPTAEGVHPTEAAIAKVEKKHPHESDAQKWRLAQAQTLIDSFIDPSGK